MRILEDINNYIIVTNKQTQATHICKLLTSNYQNYISIGNSIEIPLQIIETIKLTVKYEDQLIAIYELQDKPQELDQITIYQQTRPKESTQTNIKTLLSSIPIINNSIIRFKFQTFQVCKMIPGVYKINQQTKIDIQTRKIQQLKKSQINLMNEIIHHIHNCYLSHFGPLQQLQIYQENPYGGVTLYGDDSRDQLFQFVYRNSKTHEYQLIDSEIAEQQISNISSIFMKLQNYYEHRDQDNIIQTNPDPLSNQKFSDFYTEQNNSDPQFQLLYNSQINCLTFRQKFISRSDAQAEQARLTSKIILHLDSNDHKFYQPKLKYSLIQIIDDPYDQEQALRRQGRFGIDIEVPRINMDIRKRLIASYTLSVILYILQQVQKLQLEIPDVTTYVRFINNVVDVVMVDKLFIDQQVLSQNIDQIDLVMKQTESILECLSPFEYNDVVSILAKWRQNVSTASIMEKLDPQLQSISPVHSQDNLKLFITKIPHITIQKIIESMQHHVIRAITIFPRRRMPLLRDIEPDGLVLFDEIMEQMLEQQASYQTNNDTIMAENSPYNLQKQHSSERHLLGPLVLIALRDALRHRRVLFNCTEKFKVIERNFALGSSSRASFIGPNAEATTLNLYPQHVLLYGEDPGCGKSSICRILARRLLNYKILLVRSTDIFSQFVGESERNVSKIFSTARRLRPCILIFDGLDAIVGRRRDSQDGVEDSSGVSQKVLTTFLTELDGVTHNNDQLYCIGICGCDVKMLDSAIVRFKRFGLHIKFSNMTSNEIESLMNKIGIKDEKRRKKTEMSPFAFSQYLLQLLDTKC